MPTIKCPKCHHPINDHSSNAECRNVGFGECGCRNSPNFIAFFMITPDVTTMGNTEPPQPAAPVQAVPRQSGKNTEMVETKDLTQSERATYQSPRANGVGHTDALSDAIDGVHVDDVRNRFRGHR